MFQNTDAGATTMPSTFLRDGARLVPLAELHVRRILRPAHLHRLGDRLLLRRIGLAREVVAQLLHLARRTASRTAPCRSSR